MIVGGAINNVGRPNDKWAENKKCWEAINNVDGA